MTTATLERTEEVKNEVKNQDACSAVESCARPVAGKRVVVPRYEVFSKEDLYEIKIAMPGVDAEGLSVSVENRKLTVKGESHTLETEGLRRLYAEFTLPNYEAGFTLPATVNAEKIEAKLRNGILTLGLPLREKEQKSIKINVG